MLNRQARQIHLVAFPHDFLTRRVFDDFGRHTPNVFEQRQFGERVFNAFGRLGFFQIRQRLPDFAQLGHAVRAHAHRHAFGRTEQVGEHGKIIAAAVGLDGVFKQQRRPFGAQYAVGDFGDFQMGGDGVGDPFQAALRFKHLDKFAQVAIFHGGFPMRVSVFNHAFKGSLKAVLMLSGCLKPVRNGSLPPTGHRGRFQAGHCRRRWLHRVRCGCNTVCCRRCLSKN